MKANERAKRKQAYLKASSEISELDESKWSGTQMKELINYRRRKTDSWQQPKTRTDMLDKWKEVKDREMPPPSPVRDEVDSDEKEDSTKIEVV